MDRPPHSMEPAIIEGVDDGVARRPPSAVQHEVGKDDKGPGVHSFPPL